MADGRIPLPEPERVPWDVLIAQAVNWDIPERLGSVTKQNTPAPQWRPGPSKAEMRKQIEAAMARTAALPIKKLPPERRPKLGKRERLIRG